MLMQEAIQDQLFTYWKYETFLADACLCNKFEQWGTAVD